MSKETNQWSVGDMVRYFSAGPEREFGKIIEDGKIMSSDKIYIKGQEEIHTIEKGNQVRRMTTKRMFRSKSEAKERLKDYIDSL